MKIRRCILAAVAALSLTVAYNGTAEAHSSISKRQGASLTTLVNNSNLVFHGEVLGVDYRLAEPDRTGRRMPHTLVTYRVGKILRGDYKGETIVLKFVSGTDGAGGFIQGAGVPLFQKGDEDFLFLRSNGATGCPIVACEWGRFRILEGGVYDGLGRPLVSSRRGRLQSAGVTAEPFLKFAYPRPPFENLLKRPDVQRIIKEKGVSIDEAKAEYEKNAPEQILIGLLLPAVQRGDRARSGIVSTLPDIKPIPLKLDAWLEIVKKAADGSVRKPVEIVSWDPKAPIVFSSSLRLKPKILPPPKKAPDPKTEQERRERAALLKNGNNPVIPLR